MTIIRPDSLPRLWWLNPWATCRYLHKALVAVNALSDRQHKIIAGQSPYRPRWSIFISGLPGADRRYLFQDNHITEKDWLRRDDGVAFGKAMHYSGPDKNFTIMKSAEDAIVFCNHLNDQEESR